tara:strand:- start:43 stop:228 length:186 start_codon:yes stop_codon:yes gene_type:complete
MLDRVERLELEKEYLFNALIDKSYQLNGIRSQDSMIMVKSKELIKREILYNLYLITKGDDE